MTAPAKAGREAISEACDRAAERLRRILPHADITVVVRFGNVLRQAAHRGRLRMIYEFPRTLGGVVWRAAETARTQVVPDVRIDPDYIAVDTSVRSEIAVPVVAGGAVVAVLNAETPEDAFADADVEVVEAEASRLGDELEPLYSS